MRKRALGGLAACSLLIAGWLIWGWLKAGPSVSGTVRLDGEPLASGSIRFVPVDNTPGPDVGAVIDEGEYRVDKGLAVGTYRVEIQGTEKVPRKIRIPIMPVYFIEDEVAAVPPEYNTKSGLVCMIKPGANSYDFDLKRAQTTK